MPLSTGARIGSFEILAPFGAGGMGEVYRARDTKLGREVALKVLPAALANDADYIARIGSRSSSAGCPDTRSLTLASSEL